MFKTNNSLIVMIDIQDKLVKAVSGEKESYNAEKMVKAGNILNIPIIVSEQYPKGLGRTKAEISEQFTSKTRVIEKAAFSLLREENAAAILKSYNRNKIILFGIETHVCVLQTAYDLINEGYEVFLIENASKSRNQNDHQTGVYLMKNFGVKVVTLEIVLFNLLESSRHPNFKEIQALIK